MSSQFATSRRSLLAAAAGFAAAAALNPNPKILSLPGASAQSTEGTPTPELAEEQVLRWIGAAVPSVSIPAYANGLWIENLPNVYMTPFTQDSEGEFHPGICSEYTVSDDRLTYTFKMNPDAKWSDGSKITSHDIKYTWEWMANPTLSGNVFNYYQTQVVAGNAEVYAGTATEMSGLVAVDEDTLEITLTQPYTPFIYYCTHCLLGAHQKANMIDGGVDWDKKPTVASGPFMVEQFDVNAGSLSLVPNPYWWGKKPTIQRVEYVPISDAGTQLLTWTNDECEVWGSVTTDFYRQYGRSEVIEYPLQSVYFLLMNTKVAPLDDIHVRRALQRATDIPTMIEVVFSDFGTPATGISFPEDPAFVERPFLYDPEAAKAELALSTYASGSIPTIVAVINANPDFVKIGTVLQQMWKDELGIDLQVIPSDQSSPEQRQSAGVFDGGNSVLYLGPGGLLSWGWHKDNYWFNGRINTVDDEVEALITKGDQTPDDQLADRVAAYSQAETLILDRGYTIPLFWRPFSILAKKRVVNASLNPTVTFDLVNTFIAKQ